MLFVVVRDQVQRLSAAAAVDSDVTAVIREVPLSLSARRPRVIVEGEVDIATAPCLLRRVRHISGRRPVQLDLSAVTFMDLAGLRAIEVLHHENVARIIRASQPVWCIAEMLSVVGLLTGDEPLRRRRFVREASSPRPGGRPVP